MLQRRRKKHTEKRSVYLVPLYLFIFPCSGHRHIISIFYRYSFSPLCNSCHSISFQNDSICEFIFQCSNFKKSIIAVMQLNVSGQYSISFTLPLYFIALSFLLITKIFNFLLFIPPSHELFNSSSHSWGLVRN